MAMIARILGVTLVAFLWFASFNCAGTRPPNVVLIYLDNVGYGDIGSSGIQIKFSMNLILEGFRPGRIVRIRPNAWPKVKPPKEEQINNLESRWSSPDISQSDLQNADKPVGKSFCVTSRIRFRRQLCSKNSSTESTHET